MKTEINWAAASALAAILSLASMPTLAQSVEVSAESGNKVPIDGVWEFPGCSEPEPDDGDYYYEKEFLIYDGNTVTSQVILYPPENGGCTGDGIEEIEGPFDFESLGEVQSSGWAMFVEDDFDNVEVIEVDPPLRQDFKETLNYEPVISQLEYDLGDEGTELDNVYIDDTGEYWFLYRGASEGDDPSIYMSRDEPLRKVKVEADPGPKPECDIELTQETYVDGDTIMADVFRLSNPTAERVALEVKVWLGKPNESVKSIVNIGAYGFFKVLAETDVDLGPLWLGKVRPHKARGEYELSCRVLDPKTGELIAEDQSNFVIE